jgi:Uma2 family endonuclease
MRHMGATTGLMSFAEFERLPDHEQGWKLELLDGELIRRPPPFTPHMRIARRLFLLLTSAVGPNVGEVFFETGYRLGQNWVVPDVSVTHSGQVEVEGKYLPGAPALAIEVVSESNSFQQMHLKVLRYFEYGAREVWVFDPGTRSVAVHYGDHSLEIRDTLTTALFPGLSIHLAEVFAA